MFIINLKKDKKNKSKKFMYRDPKKLYLISKFSTKFFKIIF